MSHRDTEPSLVTFCEVFILNFLKHYKKRKLFLMFFISYIVLTLMTIFIGGISYISTLTTVRSSAEDYNLAIIEQARTAIDERMLIVEKLAVDYAVNPQVYRIGNMTDINNGDALFTISRLSTELRNSKNYNGFIKSIYIFFTVPDIVVSDEGMFTARFFYDNILPRQSLSFEEWRTQNSVDSFRGYKPIQSLKNETPNSEMLTFQQSLAFFKTDNPPGSAVVMLDKSFINQLLANANIHGEGAAIIYNKNDELLTMVGDREYLGDIDHKKLNINSAYQTKGYNGNVVVTKVQSMLTGWQFVRVVPMSVYYEKAAYVKSVVLIITFIQLLSGALVALFMAWKSYAPIKRSFEKLKDVFGYEESVLYGDYFNFIEEITSTTLREKTEIKESMNKLQPLLKTDLVNQILLGTAYSDKDMKSNLWTVGINFSTDLFAVCKINIDDCSKFTDNSSIQERALVKLVITNVTEELGEKSFNVYSTDMDKDSIAMLFNLKRQPEGLDFDGVYRELVSVITESQKFIGERFSIFISIGISNFHEGIGAIGTAYQQAEEALNYKLLKGFSSIIEFKKLEYTSNKYTYTMQTEMQLINCIKTGDSKRAEKILEEIHSKNFGWSGQSLDMVRCIFFDMVSTVIKVMDELHITQNEVWGEGNNPLSELLNSKNIQQMHYKLKEISVKLCEFINSNKKSHNVELKERILECVLKHYDENSISLVGVADELGLNSTYLSYFFKEQVGETFINYISKLRIEKAKKLLGETEMSLQDIAEDIGYANSGVFIKTFKKFEGCTPGKYRESLD